MVGPGRPYQLAADSRMDPWLETFAFVMNATLKYLSFNQLGANFFAGSPFGSRTFGQCIFCQRRNAGIDGPVFLLMQVAGRQSNGFFNPMKLRLLSSEALR
jgi:hypothetical protein